MDKHNVYTLCSVSRCFLDIKFIQLAYIIRTLTLSCNLVRSVLASKYVLMDETRANG